MKLSRLLVVIVLVVCAFVYLISNSMWTNQLVSYCEKQDIKEVKQMLDNNVIFRVNGTAWRFFPSAMFTNKTPLESLIVAEARDSMSSLLRRYGGA